MLLELDLDSTGDPQDGDRFQIRFQCRRIVSFYRVYDYLSECFLPH